ncbi:hypothetical protein DSO57_1034253 [Entomophthora muscae]|uniref:Uncharacterized protein n=1 Tax=Entomophthora muscae TaxID=34485 RepID=A0ACC2REK4_9FUNG|nr:hypothetical protein DSO57_1034253 [Entomophthora muscae]
MKNLDLVDTSRERKNSYEYITYINKHLERGGNTGSRLDYILDTKLSDHKAVIFIYDLIPPSSTQERAYYT